MTKELDRSFGQSERAQASTGAVWGPAIEVSECNGKCVVRAELAGLKPEDVKLEITDDALVLQVRDTAIYLDGWLAPFLIGYCSGNLGMGSIAPRFGDGHDRI